MAFELVPTPDQFFAAPAGRMLVRAHFAYLGASDALLSLLIWGHVGARDVSELIDVLSRAPSHKRRDALVQLQAMRGLDEDSLRTWARFMEQTSERSHAVTSREAIVRPSGTMGMIVAGFYGVVSVRYPTAIFAGRDDACAWLGMSPSVSADLAAQSDALVAAAQQSTDVVYQLRELLAAKPNTSIASAASVLGSTARTLQRRLGESDTSFEKELGQARVVAAKTLLLRTNLAVKEVAHEVGLPSASRLSQLFATHEGTSPSEWRKARADPT